MSISTFFLIAFVLPAIAAMLLVEGCRRCKPLWAIISAIGIFLIPTIIIAMFLGISAAFSGTGYYGLKVHEAALARGVKVTGATVHFVDEGTDTGPILLQKAVEVQEGDTSKILQQRVMEQAEWLILPQAIDMIAKGEVKIGEGA